MKESYVQVEPGGEDDFGLEGWAEGGKNEAKHENGSRGTTKLTSHPFKHTRSQDSGAGAQRLGLVRRMDTGFSSLIYIIFLREGF